ncbi:hypothetical protein CJF31_00005167 [Rutstroemia sp. NJR-2017a BVV2]|nr:hypothetical protein CJF31_00005167 [Rutstroemia sp. NJR-2017a BVV2]
MMGSAYRCSRSSNAAHGYQELVHGREYSWKGDIIEFLSMLSAELREELDSVTEIDGRGLLWVGIRVMRRRGHRA